MSMMSTAPHCNQGNFNRQMAAALVRGSAPLPEATFCLITNSMELLFVSSKL